MLRSMVVFPSPQVLPVKVRQQCAGRAQPRCQALISTAAAAAAAVAAAAARQVLLYATQQCVQAAAAVQGCQGGGALRVCCDCRSSHFGVRVEVVGVTGHAQHGSEGCLGLVDQEQWLHAACVGVKGTNTNRR